MAKSEFINNLKKAVEEGDFNSDAAKKINEIDKEANKIKKNKSKEDIEKSINNKIKDSGTKAVDKDNIAELNSKYEKEMQNRAKEEKIYATIATLENLEYSIDKAFDELKKFIIQQKAKYDSNDESCKNLYEKMDKLMNKYNIKINEE
jgi:uncharacterized coiled-coil protein SlyX